ncbi:hypothetical protein SAMN05421678_105245 [Actinopolymorpha cephalotaxi]|uniref:Uncharacterized protein n=1 Tax=Actinopolymorpha cephalotaxi TaxID=504797 RepID=A0A1I2R626_9ACTN|nr:hypothetical protein [Actinopolymorpha cephalotaxi]NYH82349.1 hypothetical protein [Actinopolymorpha cephalotaxi]SFG35870.1 hypothetical protein SAMN05421678_105245 [Actinopolymorpha cephalotaxi]
MPSSVLTAGPRPSPPGLPAGGPRVTLWLLRFVAFVHAGLVVGQPVLAGIYLSGRFDALATHSLNAGLVMLACMCQFGAALVYFLPGRGRGWPLLVTALLFFGEGIQTAMGYAGQLAVHVPLGVAVVTAQVVFVVWLFRAGARRPRRTLRRQPKAGERA